MAKLLFWNIKDELINQRRILFKSLIEEHEPEIICIAEGTRSKEHCASLVQFMLEADYKCFYNPLFYEESVINRQFGFKAFGLKVFYKKKMSINPFKFHFQAKDGRIIYLPLKVKGKEYSIIFTHCLSKTNEDYDKIIFLSDLNNFIETRENEKLKNDTNYEKRIIVIGDFNTQPWDEWLCEQKGLNSYFDRKTFKYRLDRKKIAKTIFYNPFYQYMSTHDDKNLIGTFYNNSYISLIDFGLFSDTIQSDDYKIEIITKAGNTPLLISKNSKTLVTEGFDHLPILINIKN